MYSQLIYFIVALLLFTIQEPGSESFRPPAQTFSAFALLFSSFVLFCYLSFKPLLKTLRRPFPPPSVTLRYHRVQNRLTIMAIAVLAIDVYVLDIKFFFQEIPGFSDTLTVSGIVGLCFYICHLVVIWYFACPVYRRIYGSAMSRRRYIKWNLNFFGALLIPWLLIALFSDLLERMTLPSYLESAFGQIFLFGIVVVAFLLFAPALVVRLWKCDPLPASPIRSELEAFCRHHRFRFGDLLHWPLFGGESLTAAVMGILPKLRYILFTRGLLNLLSVDELKAVVAHEMGHVRRYHAVFYLLFFMSYAVLSYSYLDPLIIYLLKHPTILHWAMSDDSTSRTLFSLTTSLPVLILMILYFRYLFGFFLRNSERQADLYALGLIGHPFTLISSLQKIAVQSGHIEDLPSWHHFSIRERVAYLLRCHENPQLVRRHNRKLYGFSLLFLAVLTLMTAGGFRLQNSDMVRSWRVQLQILVLEQQLQANPDDLELYGAYGGLLLEDHQYDKAEAVMLKALETAPDDPNLLNNLAWLYATAPSPYFKPRKALELALRAATLKPEPHILDTLAEAYYVNGAYQEALLTIRHAIAQHPQNMSYYLDQEKKFLSAFKKMQEGARQ